MKHGYDERMKNITLLDDSEMMALLRYLMFNKTDGITWLHHDWDKGSGGHVIEYFVTDSITTYTETRIHGIVPNCAMAEGPARDCPVSFKLSELRFIERNSGTFQGRYWRAGHPAAPQAPSYAKSYSLPDALLTHHRP